MKPEASILLFLQLAKSYVVQHGLLLVGRRESLSFVAGLGGGIDELESVILALTPADCLDGPEENRDLRYGGWTVAEFAPVHRGDRLYLKISVKIEAQRCKCLSVKLYSERPDHGDS